MISYRINPYLSFVESRLFPEFTEHAVFHRLTGELLQPSEEVRLLLQATTSETGLSFTEVELANLGTAGEEIRELFRRNFLISEEFDPLKPLLDHYVARPIQNPAVIYRDPTEQWVLVRTSMDHTVYSRKVDELPPIIEERLSSLQADIVLLADGSQTLRQIFSALRDGEETRLATDSEFTEAINYLTTQDRQLIKFTSNPAALIEPFSPVNIVPRNLYHSDRWSQPVDSTSEESITDFHLHGISDASWEFDLIEPTVNHCFRFPHEALSGLTYGARFCVSTLNPHVVPLMEETAEIQVLEVGGGTGTFAEAFINKAKSLLANRNIDLNYHILDLSPALMRNQRRVLGKLLSGSNHFHQDATQFDLPDHTFDLIISNEVIADFPVSLAERNANGNRDTFSGDGAQYISKYKLTTVAAPDSFLVNSGVFRFLERAWKHLKPGGTLIVSEYGAEHRFPARSFQLNHDEYSIHFGHLSQCANEIGFLCRLQTLTEFMCFNDELLVLNGREEHILCLNHVFKSFGVVGPLAVISKSDFERQYEKIAGQIGLTGYSFSPLKKGYHFGPNIRDFFVLVMNKPR